MRVKIRESVTREQLSEECGICTSHDLLLSGIEFLVKKTSYQERRNIGSKREESGTMVYVVNPNSETHSLWVWEEMVSYVD